MATKTMQDAMQAQTGRRASPERPEVSLAEFDYILQNLRSLLTEAECSVLTELEARITDPRCAHAPWYRDVERFVHAVRDSGR